uniref:Xylanolytic transcriptional activator regulatory domain-containing protein n=1 Tax=Bionectria ochroleuca TaxID=29856 RepID=A0A8H7NHZ0_BIOOC
MCCSDRPLESPCLRLIVIISRPKVCLAYLARASRRELLQAYFHNLHPILPILDVGILNRLHNPEGISTPELLIFWSLASVAVNYVQSSMWQLEGFHFRKELRDRFYELAKCTFNVGGVTDKERLLQSALLLGFWHLDRDSHSQPWHWTGIAVSLCQIIGLHRNPDSVKINPSVTQYRRRMWRRLWGACIFRDRWLSLTLGRPMRIHLKDCDMPFPTVEDVMGDVADIPTSLRDLYLPPDLAQLSECGMAIQKFSKALESIISLGYQQNGLAPTLQQCEDLEGELLRSDICGLASCQGSRVGAFYLYHAQLHYQATLITFYRPFLVMTPSDLPPAAEGPWRDSMRNRLEAAAASTNTIVDSIVREGLISYAGPMTPPLLVPAMHVHLLNCKSENPLTQTLGYSKLELCMAVMRELQKTYTSASIFCGIFNEVLAQLSRDYTPSLSSGWASQSRQAGSIPTQEVATEPGLSDQEQIPFDNELLERLLNESLANNMWESMSMLDHSFDLPNEGW